MDVLVLIDKLDDQVHNAKPVPLTDQVRVDKEEIYDILDQMRATIPEEIKQAARAREREIRLGAEDYADDTLNTLEVNLSKFIAAVQRGRDRLQGREGRGHREGQGGEGAKGPRPPDGLG